ncbi:glycosyltransferase family 4 protein [Garicola koreensis]|uniref:Glycosyltransferase involved in cell wall biosynthesis n=1 Tax=Garicola koreensis TaxID=1262554 RepID=A0A7W5U1L5_9MICC|nr:glycosyltransferase family 4 protein [Garicola koreensis]MBB3667561.1 glycosyltransferase involved in cell wall biosynthesis [Garicola koreensis]
MSLPAEAPRTRAGRSGTGRAVVVPRDLPGPSGGLTYNREVLKVWKEDGVDVVQERLEGAWPDPDDHARRALSELLLRYSSVLVDGIIASAAPQQIAGARASGVQVSVLMHLPLPAETGLSAAERASAQAMERHALQQASTVVCTSEWARADLRARYGALPTQVAAPGTDPAPLVDGSSPPRLLFLGAITPRKNPLLLLQALEPLDSVGWQLTIAGPAGPDQDYVHSVTAAAQRCRGRVQLTGAVTGERLQRLWNAADLLVLPSLAETYGMVVTEGLARGVPALVGAGTGAEEALAAGQDPACSEHFWSLPGRAVDPCDAAAWTEALEQWLQHQELRSRWRANAAAHRDRLRTWRQTATQLRRALQW